MRTESKIRALEFLQHFSFMLLEIPNFSLQGNKGVTIKDLIPVLLPIAGFSSCSSPEMTANVEEINPGNQSYPYKHITSWTYSTISLMRGASIARVDLGAWVQGVMKGQEIRRNFLLVHFTRSAPLGQPELPFGFAKLFTIPAKAWLLESCYPVRYKTVSDFDAMSGDISIEEMDLEPIRITDYTSSGINFLKSLI